MWDLIVSVPDHCLSFYFKPGLTHFTTETLSLPLLFPFDISSEPPDVLPRTRRPSRELSRWSQIQQRIDPGSHAACCQLQEM